MARVSATSLVALVSSFVMISSFAATATATAAAADDDVVVTANRIPMSAGNLGSSVSVINAEDLKRMQARNVGDALRHVPGLSVSRNGGTGGQTSVRVRGMESYHTLVLIDGVEVADPSGTQQSYDFGHLLVNNIERIEIVRGPQSTLYGADAIGGVINIITRRGDGTPTVTGLAEVGGDASKLAQAGVSGKTGRVSYAVQGTYDKTNGISAADDRDGNTEADGYENRTLNGTLGVNVTDWLSLETSFRAVESDLEVDGWSFPAGFADSNDTQERSERSGRVAANVDTFGGSLKHMVAASYSSTKRDYLSAKVHTDYFDGKKDKLEYQGTWTIDDIHTVVAGLENERERADTSSGVKASVQSRAGYADWQAALLDRSLFLTLGARLDNHEEAGAHDTYRATLAYFVDTTQTRLHTSWGTGFRAPSLYELYESVWGYGNPDLRPETSRGWDAGVEQTLWDGRAVADVTVFRNDTQDLIQWQASGYTNINSARAFGVESSLTLDLVDDLTVTAAHTYTETRNNATGAGLVRRPKHTVSADLDWSPIEDLQTGLSMIAVAHNKDTNRYLGGYAVFGATASYALTESATLFGRVENLFDKQYEEVDTYGTPGRNAYIGVRLSY